jgi:hypothetical protein
LRAGRREFRERATPPAFSRHERRFALPMPSQRRALASPRSLPSDGPSEPGLTEHTEVGGRRSGPSGRKTR